MTPSHTFASPCHTGSVDVPRRSNKLACILYTDFVYVQVPRVAKVLQVSRRWRPSHGRGRAVHKQANSARGVDAAIALTLPSTLYKKVLLSSNISQVQPKPTYQTKPQQPKMKLALLVATLISAALAAPNDPPSTSCGRGTQPGFCTTKEVCYAKGGTFVGREHDCGPSLTAVCCYVRSS
jgi:hypothetical protein